MELFVLDPETALQLQQIVLYSLACLFVGAAFIGLSVYVVLVCSEMLSQSRPKPQRAKASQSARRAPVAEEAFDLSATETPILDVPELLPETAMRVTAPPEKTQIPMMAIFSAVGAGLRRIARREQMVRDGSFD